ncbi:MAG: methyl-accepting chemotaxis protein, partial [Piscinibacter sp.]|nr:methyl-accepting chemotaxis protein [Piscinibacter sp.]
MSFRNRLLLCSAVPAAMFLVALAVGLWGLLRTQGEFDKYIGTEQAIANGFNEMYAQGLQMGQALRNVVLDPANRKAYDNFASAESTYAKAAADVAALARGTGQEAALGRLGQLREAQAAKQARVMELVKSDPKAAAAALTAEETPAWRELRGALLERIELGRSVAAQAHETTRARARRLTWWAAALALGASLVAGGMCVLMQRTVHRELGGEPATAREALRRMAEGDLSHRVDAAGMAQGLMHEMGRMQQGLRELITFVRGSADSIRTASSEVASGSQDLSS